MAKSFIKSKMRFAVDDILELSPIGCVLALVANDVFDEDKVERLDVGLISVGVIRTALAPAPDVNLL